ncbi:hypothetical protein H1220_03845 [Carnobacteriaceae bacterium zg-84]|uniref:hypothetical protein n=1 Tax=Granulicatella sp. zg-84 TaxID=2678503 RepID=UPI0013C1B9F5|nr:hypothetical protein [Granulicatella sp. zg-84]NEW66966.1 hypothetical protein [Granulicatella sp. zg-84]QMI86488.1 hypothetical protein H1220_03845 [Carnobacteriaceae bacterium zg-84]
MKRLFKKTAIRVDHYHTEYSFGYKEWYTHVFHSRRYKVKIYNNFLSAEAVAKQIHGTVIAL